MGHTRGHIGTRGWSNGEMCMEINGSRTRTVNNERMVSLEDPNFLGKILWKVGTQSSREYHAGGNHTFKDKFQGKEPTVT